MYEGARRNDPLKDGSVGTKSKSWMMG